MLMLILLEVGIQESRWTQTTITQELDMPFNMLAAPFIGKANFKLRLLSPLLKLSILHYLKLWRRHCLWLTWWRRKSMWSSLFICHCQSLLSKFKKIINHELLWLTIPSSLLQPKTLPSSTITFASILSLSCIPMDLSKSITAPQMIRLQIYSWNLFVMISLRGCNKCY